MMLIIIIIAAVVVTKISKAHNVSTQAESEALSVNRRVKMKGGRWEKNKK